VVSTCKNFLLRGACGRTAGGIRKPTVPSMIFNSALLHDLARDVEGDRGIVGLAADLVDFVDKTAAGRVRRCSRPTATVQVDVLDVYSPDIASRCASWRRHGEGHATDARQRLREQRSCPKPVGPISRMFDFARLQNSCAGLMISRL